MVTGPMVTVRGHDAYRPHVAGGGVHVAGHGLIPGRIGAAWAGILRPAAILWPGIVWTLIFWAAAGGRNQGQRPEQQADEDLGAQQVHAPARTGGLHGLRHGTDPCPGGGRLRGGQASSDSEAVPS
jgi:hypothetical protein